jgi:group I intron endonuclease
MTQIVYGLYNTVEDKWYIGSSRQPNNRRKVEHFSKLRSGTHENKKLQGAANLHGVSSFIHLIIEEIPDDLSDHIRLLRLEEFYIKEFSSFTNGYNNTDNTIGSCMSNIEVRSKHWGELHGGSSYTNAQIEKAFLLLAHTSSNYHDISELTGVQRETLGYIKKGGHEWVHLKFPELSNIVIERVSIKESHNSIYTNEQALRVFKTLLDTPMYTFGDVSKLHNIPVETISAISSGRQYKNIITSTYNALAIEYYSLGKIAYTKKYGEPPSMKYIFDILHIFLTEGYMSRDKIKARLGATYEAPSRKVVELDIYTWDLIVKWYPQAFEDLITIVTLISSRKKFCNFLQRDTVLEMINKK